MESEKSDSTLERAKIMDSERKSKILDAISNGLFGKSTESQTLHFLAENDGIRLDDSKVPASAKFNPQDKTSIINFFRGILKSSNDPELNKTSEAELERIVNTLQNNTTDNTTKSYVKAPISFGTENLSSKDIDVLRNFKKDLKDVITVEISLEFIKNFHTSNNSKFSEASLINNLHVALPNSTILSLTLLKRTKSSLAQIFAYLCFNHGVQKSESEIKEEVYELMESNKPPLEVLTELNNLLQSTGENLEMINKLCLEEARRYLRKSVGAHIANSINNSFQLCGSNQYYDFFRIVKLQYASELKKKRSIHHIDETPTIDDFHSFKNEITTLMQSMLEKPTVNQIEEKPPRKCYECESTNHLVRECPRRKHKQSKYSNSKKSLQKVGYAALKCSVHRNANHINFDCILQRNPCSFSPSHATHQQGKCRRRSNNILSNNQQSSFQPQFPQGGNQFVQPNQLVQPPPIQYMQPGQPALPPPQPPQPIAQINEIKLKLKSTADQINQLASEVQ